MHLTSAANPRLKFFASLLRKRERVASGLFLVEGWEFVGMALRAGWAIETLLYAQGEEHPLLEAAVAASSEVYTTTLALLGKVSGRENPQPVVAIFKQRWVPLEMRDGFWIGLDRPRDPGNVGSILRTADAAGAAGVVLIGDAADPYGPESIRATMGSIFNVLLAKIEESHLVEALRDFGGAVIGTSLTGAVDYRLVTKQRPALLLMGNEQQGLSERLQAACSQLVTIPLRGGAESLNLAAATAVMAFELDRDNRE